MNTPLNFIEEFVNNSIYRIDENTEKIGSCLEQISEEQVWLRPNKNSNSIGNQLLHLCGNMTQYGIVALSDKKDERMRDAEFETTGGLSKQELLSKFHQVVLETKQTLKGLQPEDYHKMRSVQAYNFSGIGIIIHYVEHLSYHTGQIVFFTKQLLDKQMGFYDNVDLN
ncbi:DinB family protein [Jiulongibacter sp. NS-SX5]|uniref:DinB family protein n=1 Tax=Jiulongibacter sp. NS-SX5 TaxID=3463854 RepID=UPI004059F007